MDYIREFDIRLDREMYYAGETLSGCVILSTKENFKLKGEYGVFDDAASPITGSE